MTTAMFPVIFTRHTMRNCFDWPSDGKKTVESTNMHKGRNLCCNILISDETLGILVAVCAEIMTLTIVCSLQCVDMQQSWSEHKS